MRLLEWLLVLSFIPHLLIPFIPQKQRQISLIIAIMLLLFCAGLHLLLEGWRVQMLPIYGLAAVLILGRLYSVFRPNDALRPKRGYFLSFLLALMLLPAIVLAAWALPVLRLPELTGPYAVGIVDRELFDAARDRRLMVSIWYPATIAGDAAPLTHYPNEVATALSNLSGLPSLLYQHLGYAKLSASENATPSPENAPLPVLVFSHGMVGLRLQNSATLQNLASWGYIVIAIDHTDAAAVTVFPDGAASYYDLSKFGVPSGQEVTIAMMNEFVFPAWIADQIFVYDSLEIWAENDTLLAGKLDLNRIASFGHSFGGATALEVCRIESRCRAAVNMDGALYGDTAVSAATRPMLLMTSAASQQFPEAVAGWSQVIENASAPAYWLELPNSNHFSFTITPLLSPLLVPDGFNPHEGLQIIDDYLRLFFDAHLRGTGEFPIDGTDVNWLSS